MGAAAIVAAIVAAVITVAIAAGMRRHIVPHPAAARRHQFPAGPGGAKNLVYHRQNL
jgi:hypothetical protein